MVEKVIEQFVSELSHSSERTRRDRAFYARKFLDFAGERPLSEWNKGLVNAFLDSLKEEGYAAGTIRNVYGIVKRVFDAARAVYESERTRLIGSVNPDDRGAVAQILQAMALPGPVWDVGKRAAPRVESADVVKPAATLEEMEAMVGAARKGLLHPPEVAFLALSSVYGLRREELVQMRPEYIDYRKGVIFMPTAKGGERREQLLAPELEPYLHAYDFRKQYSRYGLSWIWYVIERKSGLPHKEGAGWHSPRRFLDTELVKTLGELDAHIFLRWKISSSSLMVQRYYTEDYLEVDKRVLSQHPIVSLWR